jgi:hypothetical protein
VVYPLAVRGKQWKEMIGVIAFLLSLTCNNTVDILMHILEYAWVFSFFSSPKFLFLVVQNRTEARTYYFFLTLDIASELSGTEDPIFLYPVVLNWSVKGAVKEGGWPECA